MTSTATRRDAARQTVGLASVGAGVIHLALGPDHMAEWTVLGYGFFVSGAVPLLLGARLLRTESRRLLALATVISLTLIGCG